MAALLLRGRSSSAALIEAPATEDAEWVVRDEHGAVVVVEDDPAREEVELQCDSCSGGLNDAPLWRCAATWLDCGPHALGA